MPTHHSSSGGNAHTRPIATTQQIEYLRARYNWICSQGWQSISSKLSNRQQLSQSEFTQYNQLVEYIIDIKTTNTEAINDYLRHIETRLGPVLFQNVTTLRRVTQAIDMQYRVSSIYGTAQAIWRDTLTRIFNNRADAADEQRYYNLSGQIAAINLINDARDPNRNRANRSLNGIRAHVGARLYDGIQAELRRESSSTSSSGEE